MTSAELVQFAAALDFPVVFAALLLLLYRIDCALTRSNRAIEHLIRVLESQSCCSSARVDQQRDISKTKIYQ